MGAKEYTYERIGRPTIMTPETVKRLEDAFALGCTDEEACLYADIGTSTLYNFQNSCPDFVERKNELKQRPFLKARQTILKNLDNPEMAKWYMERKKKNEFAQRTENTGADGKDLIPEPMSKEKQIELLNLLNK